MEQDVFDTIIIGAGPAGLTAAIYCARKALKTLIISKDIGGQANYAAKVENYLGFTMISGVELVRKFKEDVERFEGQGLWIKEGKEVEELTGEMGNFLVQTKDQEQYRTKTVIIASGRMNKFLGVPGEKELLGKGVTVCSTCDGPFFKEKAVVVVGGGNSALDAALYMSKIAQQVMIINLNEQLNGDQVLLEKVGESSNIKVRNKTEVVKIVGENFVGGVVVKNRETHQEEVIPTSGVVVEIGWTPATAFDCLTSKNEKGEIIVDEFGQTSIKGIWAAGDVNNLKGEQIIIACGEGAKVALSVAEYLMKLKTSGHKPLSRGFPQMPGQPFDRGEEPDRTTQTTGQLDQVVN